MNEQDERRFTESARRALDEAAERLDAGTLERLAAARRQALDAARAARGARAPGGSRRWLWPATAVAFASATVAAVALWLWFASPAAPLNGFEDLELLAAQEHPEFYQDLDFYVWLASQTPAT
jgi:hypothetical protein